MKINYNLLQKIQIIKPMSLNIFLYISKQSYSFHVDYSPQMEEPSSSLDGNLSKCSLKVMLQKEKKNLYLCQFITITNWIVTEVFFLHPFISSFVKIFDCLQSYFFYLFIRFGEQRYPQLYTSVPLLCITIVFITHRNSGSIDKVRSVISSKSCWFNLY